MTLFEGEQNGRYETNHLHMVLNEHIYFTEEGLSDDRKYSIFVHEYVHYYQHFATLYGSQFCKMANLLFIETRAFLEGADKVVMPFGIWEHNEGISRYRNRVKAVCGSKSCSQNISEVYAMMKEPCSFSYMTFNVYGVATLYVPIGCKEKYENQNYWNQFQKIVETDFSGVTTAKERDANEMVIETYDLQGRKTKPQRGISIERRADGTARKVLVK